MRSALTIVLVLAALAVPAPAAADDDRPHEARVACAGGNARLRLADGERGTIEIELRLEARRRLQTVRVVLLHERTLVFAGLRRTSRSGTLRVERTVDDWPGRETATARISTPGGRTCVLVATI